MTRWLPRMRWRPLEPAEALALECSAWLRWEALELVWLDRGLVIMVRGFAR